MKTRILVTLALATLLALVTGTAIAGTVRTPFTGTTWVIDENWDDVRFWEPGRNMHWRDVLILSQIDATDPRISGLICWMHNGDYRPSADDPCFGSEGTMHGTVHIEQDGDLDCWNAVDGWEGTFVGLRHPNGLETFEMNVKGFGKYAGLQARFHEASTGCWGDQEVLQIEGEITDPGGN